MRRLSSAAAGALLMGLGLASPPAGAEPAEIRLLQQHGLAYLPLMIVEHEKLLEKQIAAAGLDAVKIDWVEPAAGTATGELLLAGKIDVIAPELPGLAVLWDRSWGTPHEVRALAALESTPYVLVARNPAIKTIRDFTAKDRIAVPALRLTWPALALEMAAAQEWGSEHFGQFAAITVGRPSAEAAAELLSGKSEIDAHFADLPYYAYELADPAVHRVMDSYDIGGPHTTTLIAATQGFHDLNPKLCAALLAALAEADVLIKNNRGEAAEIYIAMLNDTQSSVEDLTDILGDPDADYTTTPAGVMRTALFMHQVGRLKHRPQSWQDLFFPEAQLLPGS